MIKSSLLFALLIVFLSCGIRRDQNDSKSKNYIGYYLSVYKADSLYLEGNYSRCFSILDSLFKIYEPANMNNFFEYGIYLNSAAKTNNTKNFKRKVENGYLKYGGIKTFHENRNDMYKLVNDIAKLSIDDIKKLKLRYYHSLNFPLRKRILQMQFDDQEARTRNSTIERLREVDFRNLLEINKIFNQFGYPKKRIVGANSAYDIPDGGVIYLETLFLHQPDSIKLKYLPIILDNVILGNCEPALYAIVYDRMLFDSIGKQLYGTYSCENGCALVNERKIDSIRSSIGLPHIRYETWKQSKLGY